MYMVRNVNFALFMERKERKEKKVEEKNELFVLSSDT